MIILSEYNQINEFRKKLDDIDDKILDLLIERFNIISLIGQYKKEKNIGVIQEERINFIINKARVIAEKNKFDSNSFERIYKTIIDEACSLEEKII